MKLGRKKILRDKAEAEDKNKVVGYFLKPVINSVTGFFMPIHPLN
jgi:hypothetical protein